MRKKNFFKVLAIACLLATSVFVIRNAVEAVGATYTDKDNMWTITYGGSTKFEQEVPGMFELDFFSSFSMDYIGAKPGDFQYSYVDSGFNLLGTKDIYISGSVINKEDLPVGTAYIIFQKHVIGHHNLPDTWSVKVNYETITVTTGVDKYLNPSSITNAVDRSSAINWVIKDASGTAVLSGTGEVVTQAQLNTLSDGVYTIDATSNDATIYGNPISSAATTTFEIKKPQSVVQIDKLINPEIISVDKKLSDSTLTWELKDSAGNIITIGTGTTVPTPSKNGVYTVVSIETSSDGIVSITEGVFEILTGVISTPSTSIKNVEYQAIEKKAVDKKNISGPNTSDTTNTNFYVISLLCSMAAIVILKKRYIKG